MKNSGLKLNCIVRCVLLSLSVISNSLAYAESELKFSGHIKLRSAYIMNPTDSLGADAGPDDGFLNDYNFRPRVEYNYDSWTFQTEAEINGIGGNAKPGVEAVLFGRPLLENDDRRILNLSTDEGNSSFSRTSRIDRLLVSYSEPSLNVALGRQSYSYGQGLVFSALDVFNPFSPVAYDTEFKIGEDMLTFRKELSSSVTLGMLAVGRRNESNSIMANESSFGTHLTYQGDEFETNMLLARHFGGNIVGLGFNYTILGAILRSDIAFNEGATGGNWIDFLLNIDRGFVILDYNIVLFMEYFKSGLASSRPTAAIIDQELMQRLRRGELFTLSEQYLAGGGRIEISDRINFINLLILNLQDASSVYRPFFEIENSDNSRVRLGGVFFLGGSGSEFGGFKTEGLPADIRQANQLFLQYAYYF